MIRAMRALVLVFLLLAPRSVFAVSADVFIHASLLSGIPVEGLLAVSHVESRFNPNALNVGGRSYFPSSRKEAERILTRSGDNVDIGLMQVNYGIWGKRLGLSKLDLLDPAMNVLLGAKILRYYVLRSQDWWDGVGFYHSSAAERQAGYRDKVRRSYSQVISRVRR